MRWLALDLFGFSLLLLCRPHPEAEEVVRLGAENEASGSGAGRRTFREQGRARKSLGGAAEKK